MAKRPPRINGKVSWTVKRPWFCCAVCGDVVPRRSNSQKYCDSCRQVATSRAVAAYYRRNREAILQRKVAYREDNHDRLIEAQRQYNIETKAERLTRAELRGEDL